jgi:hypothetical protein
MPDTIIGDFKNLVCSDCGEKGCTFKHWGPLVPKREIGSFCTFCWNRRREQRVDGEDPLPLGIQPPGIPAEFANNTISVETESKALYFLRLTGKKDERIIWRERSGISSFLHFNMARVMHLEIGKILMLKPRCSEDTNLWSSTPVVNIKIVPDF